MDDSSSTISERLGLSETTSPASGPVHAPRGRLAQGSVEKKQPALDAQQGSDQLRQLNRDKCVEKSDGGNRTIGDEGPADDVRVGPRDRMHDTDYEADYSVWGEMTGDAEITDRDC